MRFWDKRDLPFTYSLASQFPIGQRYFCSTLCQTYPNRRFFFTGTASGLISTNLTQTNQIPAANGTIWDRLDAHAIDYAIYYQNLPSWSIVPGTLSKPGRGAKQHKFDQFYTDVAAGRLPSFTFLDPNYSTTSEENPQDVQVGEQFIARGRERADARADLEAHRAVHHLRRARRLLRPCAAAAGDQARQHRADPRPGDKPGGYDRYGFRVPLIVVSPWARRGYASNVVQDHTSITAFIERKWNLPAMTFRDANAQPMTDYFDFSNPAFAKPPPLAAAPGLAPGVAACHRDGLDPPLPTTKNDGAADVGR